MASAAEQVEVDVRHLQEFVAQLGERGEDGKIAVTFGVLFDSDDVQQTLESLVGSLKAAKKRGIVEFQGQMLLKGVHDDTVVTLLQEAEGDAGAAESAAAPAADES